MPASKRKRALAVKATRGSVQGGQDASQDADESHLETKRAHMEHDLTTLDEQVSPSDDDTTTNNSKTDAKKTNQGSYNDIKTFNGQYYSGMAVGGSHTWKYDPGIWREIKEEPDLWKID